MAKIKWYSYLLNEEGQPISGADISIYLANSDTPAKIYTSETGTTATSTVPQLQTNEDGYFEFWLGYIDDDNAYNHHQKFKISWYKSNITNGYNDYISIVPPDLNETWAPVNEDGYDTTRNKTISDNLARGWEEHRTFTDYYIHGIEAVDETDTNTVINKLVSNKLAKDWEDHKDNMSYFVHGLSAVDETDTDTTYNKLVSNDLAKEWEDHKDDMSYYLHGLSAVDESGTLTESTSAIKNKLVSDGLAVGWEDHKNLEFYDVPHGIEEVDSNDDDETRNKLVSNYDLYYLQEEIFRSDSYTEMLSSGTFEPSGSEYVTVVEHGLSDEWPLVTLYEQDTRQQVSPVRITSINVDLIELWVAEEKNYIIKVTT